VIIESVGMIVGGIVLATGLGALALELQYRLRPRIQLEVTAGAWQLEVYEPQHYQIVGEMLIQNSSRRFEVMVPEMQCQVKLLSSASLTGITCQSRVIPDHPDASSRPDDYWFAYIVKTRKSTQAKISVDIHGEDLSHLKAAWLQVHYVSYGPEGREAHVRHVIVPLKFPSAEESRRWRPAPGADLLPIRTHLLTHLDSPVDVVRRYAAPHAKPGDVLTIGETPLAIMQGRLHHPSEVKPGWVARRLCLFFLPTSSLATACGLQTLVDIVGPGRVVVAFLIGSLAKLLGKPGAFYQLAGEQARLIDDVTGTLPPYDQFIVLGPTNTQQIVDHIKRETGLAAAIVDVNDLKAVKILAVTSDVSPAFLTQALRSNPAGNADEQTPLVLIRPTPSPTSA
jgi:hypothetical protein